MKIQVIDMVDRQTNLSFLNGTRMTSVNQELRKLRNLIESKLEKDEGIRDTELTTHLGTIIASMDETMDKDFKKWVVGRNQQLKNPLWMLRTEAGEENPESARAKSVVHAQTISLTNVSDLLEGEPSSSNIKTDQSGIQQGKRKL